MGMFHNGRGAKAYLAPEAESLFIELDRSIASILPGNTEPYTKEDVDPEFE